MIIHIHVFEAVPCLHGIIPSYNMLFGEDRTRLNQKIQLTVKHYDHGINYKYINAFIYRALALNVCVHIS